MYKGYITVHFKNGKSIKSPIMELSEHDYNKIVSDVNALYIDARNSSGTIWWGGLLINIAETVAINFSGVEHI